MNWNQQDIRQRVLMEAYRAYVLYGKSAAKKIIIASGIYFSTKYIRTKMPGFFRRYRPRVRRTVHRRKSRLGQRISRLERGITGKEVKTHDVTVTTTPTTTLQYQNIVGIEQGNESGQREGLRINILSLQVIVRLTTASTKYNSYTARLMVIMDKETNGAVPTANTLLETDTVIDFPAHEYRHRYNVLLDKKVVMNATSGTTTTSLQNQRIIKYYKKFKKPITIFYGGTGTSIANISKNALHYVFLTDANTSCAQTSRLRVRYTD